MPLTNGIINKLNEITSFVSNKKKLAENDEEFIKKIFKEILEEGNWYDVFEIESWFALEGSWKDKTTVDRIANIAHYQQSKFEANNKLKFVTDDCGCGN